MVNTAKHDRQDAIQKATCLFWKKGFHATSMRNLQEVIDMRPGSIYASFGSKEGLFKEALRHYANTSLAQLTACIETATSPLEALKMFIQGSVIRSRTSSPSGMCMLVKTISELTEDNADLLAEAKRLLSVVEDAFAALLAQAKKCGELDESKDPRRLACFLQMQLMGLRAYARANDSDARVNELIDDAFYCLHNVNHLKKK
jgi:AcrR family transcriptional regulator